MKPTVKKSNKPAAFTIVELLTVMSIIVILIGLLVPALNRVKRYARVVGQKNQFYRISVGLELFSAEQDGYPDSKYDPPGQRSCSGQNTEEAYCGAMKLCEAIMGQDLMGFHPDSCFASNYLDHSGIQLYDRNPTDPGDDPPPENLEVRKGPYLEPENANAYRLTDLYSDAGDFYAETFVLCDVYTNVVNISTGKRIGMPILYYKANTSGSIHDPEAPTNPMNIYNFLDNHKLVGLGKPWDPGAAEPHPLFKVGSAPEGQKFYEITRNENIKIEAGRPYRPDSYILISAGFDGEYGTGDDVFNFER